MFPQWLEAEEATGGLVVTISTTTEPAIRVRDLTKSRKTLDVLCGVDFDVVARLLRPARSDPARSVSCRPVPPWGG